MSRQDRAAIAIPAWVRYWRGEITQAALLTTLRGLSPRYLMAIVDPDAYDCGCEECMRRRNLDPEYDEWYADDLDERREREWDLTHEEEPC